MSTVTFQKRSQSLFLLLMALWLVACSTIRTDNEVRVKTESEIKPIHITVDVNVRVQRELNDFFGDIDQASKTVVTPASTTNVKP